MSNRFGFILNLKKVGGFVGYLFVDKINVSVELVRNGLSKVIHDVKKIQKLIMVLGPFLR